MPGPLALTSRVEQPRPVLTMATIVVIVHPIAVRC
jgi:hypothetical protein